MMRASLLLAGLFGLLGCGFDVTQFGGHDYTEHHGVLVVDGTPLPSKRWVAVDVPVGTGSLELGSATADIARKRLAQLTDGLVQSRGARQ